MGAVTTVEIKVEDKIVDAEKAEEKKEKEKTSEAEVENEKKNEETESGEKENEEIEVKEKENEETQIDNAVTSSVGQPWETFAEKVNLEHQEVAMEVEIESASPPPPISQPLIALPSTAPPPSKRAAWDFSPLDPDE